MLVEQDTYLAQVSRQIHLNPLKDAGRKRGMPEARLQYLNDYEWSSLPGYILKAKRPDFVEYNTVLTENGGDTKSRSWKISQPACL